MRSSLSASYFPTPPNLTKEQAMSVPFTQFFTLKQMSNAKVGYIEKSNTVLIKPHIIYMR